MTARRALLGPAARHAMCGILLLLTAGCARHEKPIIQPPRSDASRPDAPPPLVEEKPDTTPPPAATPPAATPPAATPPVASAPPAATAPERPARGTPESAPRPGNKTAPTAGKTPVPADRTPKPAPLAAAPPSPVAPPPLDLNALETRLKSTKAIGVFTKISLKNKVDDLLDQFRAYHGGKARQSVTELRRSYDLLMMKVLSLLQDDDPNLATTIVASREAIWGLLVDPKKFAMLQT